VTGGTDPVDLVRRIAGIVGQLGEVVSVDEESVVVTVGATRASLRVLALAPGLDVVSVIQLVADRVTNSEALRDMIETAGSGLSFGSLRRSDPEHPITDVLLYYTFPAGTLADDALLTLLHIVLSSGADLAEAVG
jgi:hypothetical protein